MVTVWVTVVGWIYINCQFRYHWGSDTWKEVTVTMLFWVIVTVSVIVIGMIVLFFACVTFTVSVTFFVIVVFAIVLVKFVSLVSLDH